jgi:diadenosine tetraphosphate (Ap4A) HIT family hydrolase
MNSHQVADNNCEFCDEFAGGKANSFAAHYGNEIACRTIMAQDNFRVLPSLGQIVPGYLLLVPNHHYRALADMSSEDLIAAETLKVSLKEHLRYAYGDCLFFEHGARTPDSGGCGINHAHLHIVPFPSEKDPVEKLTRAFPFEEVSDFLAIKCIEPRRAYLYYESVRGDRYIFYPRFIRSQYIRQLLSEALGSGSWDWRQCGKEKRFLDTLARTSQLVAVTPR